MSAKKRGLGRGLDALLATSQSQKPVEINEVPVTDDNKGELQKLPVEFLQRGRYQPRKDMSSEALEELASSIRSQGIIQPIVVRQVADEKYEIIAGERRWRAAQLAELDVVPCLVKDVPDEVAVAIALIENIQREDLNAMEEAQALERLIIEFELTHQEVAEAVGKSRTTVTNLLRLNNLNDDVKTLLEHGDIEMGHARALLSLEGEQQSEAAQTVSNKGMTVRDTESLVRKIMQPKAEKPKPVEDPDVKNLETRLGESLGTKVAISHNAKGKGKMVINFTNLEQLDGILSHIQKNTD
jgi:ParB family chromosome partitioning protein